jgi:hypothetical protein
MIVTFSIVNGVLMPKFGYYMPWYVGGSALVVIGSSLMCKSFAREEFEVLLTFL